MSSGYWSARIHLGFQVPTTGSPMGKPIGDPIVGRDAPGGCPNYCMTRPAPLVAHTRQLKLLTKPDPLAIINIYYITRLSH